MKSTRPRATDDCTDKSFFRDASQAFAPIAVDLIAFASMCAFVAMASIYLFAQFG